MGVTDDSRADPDLLAELDYEFNVELAHYRLYTETNPKTQLTLTENGWEDVKLADQLTPAAHVAAILDADRIVRRKLLQWGLKHRPEDRLVSRITVTDKQSLNVVLTSTFTRRATTDVGRAIYALRNADL